MSTAVATSATRRPTMRDVAEGRAYMRIPPVGRIMLLHMAGFPWNEKVETARMSALQAECIFRPERELLLSGGTGLGKSAMGGGDGVEEAMLPQAKGFVVGGVYEHVAHEFEYIRQGLLNLFRGHQGAFTRMVVSTARGKEEFEVRTKWRAKIRGLSTNSREGRSLLGNEASKIICAEGSQINEAVMGKRLRRALDRHMMHDKRNAPRRTGYLKVYTTPDEHRGISGAEHARIKRAGRGDLTVYNYPKVPWAQSVWIRKAKSTENPTFSKEAVAAAEAAAVTPEQKAVFRETYEGEIGYASGRVLADFSFEHHKVPMPPLRDIFRMKLAVGIDTGAYSAAILAGLDQRRVVWFLGEVYEIKVRTDQFADRIRDMLLSTLRPVFGLDEHDEEDAWQYVRDRISDWYVDPAAQVKLDLAYALGIDTLTPAHRGEGRFDLLETLHQMGSGMKARTLLVCEHLEQFGDQTEGYIWKTVRVPGKDGTTVKEPRKVDDHLIDAGRFVYGPLSQDQPLDEAPEPVTFEDAWRREQMRGIRAELEAELSEGPTYQHMLEEWG